MTLALNILGLSVPLAAQLIFNRVLGSPGSSTLTFVVVGVIVLAALEAVVRYSRSYLQNYASAAISAQLVGSLLEKLVESRFDAGQRGAALGLDYFNRIAQVAEKQSGKLFVAVVELLFLPMILLVIFLASVPMALLISATMILGVAWTAKVAANLRRSTSLLSRQTERRYRFLLRILGSMHAAKAFGLEQHLQRGYERLQTQLAKTSMRTSASIVALMESVSKINLMISFVVLVYGAYAASRGEMSLGTVSALFLLSGRLMAPLQRAVLILAQTKDLCEAEQVLDGVFNLEACRRRQADVELRAQGLVSLRGVAFSDHNEGSSAGFANLDLTVGFGEMVVISGAGERDRTRLLRIIAGIEQPLKGEVLINEKPVDDLTQAQINQSLAYVNGEAQMFKGTIRDNITRFGTVGLDQAMSVAALMDIQSIVNELPRGIDTELNGTINENVPSGVCQQLAFLRSVVLRPKIILLDNIDSGLDRQSYARLQRFLGHIRGQATMIVVSDDRNFTAGADRHVVLTPYGLRADTQQRQITPFRSLKI